MKRTSHLIPLLLGTTVVLIAVACGGGQAVSLGPVGNTDRKSVV